jgi:tetratricopeptide (TPR) repeat protein
MGRIALNGLRRTARVGRVLVALHAVLWTASAAGQPAAGINTTTQAQARGTAKNPDNPEPPAAYQDAVELGFREFELHNYPEARVRFLEAERLYPNARISRALGMVEYETRNYSQAVVHLARALTLQVRPLVTPERGETEQLLALAQGYLARYRILTQPADARLQLNGSPVTLNADHSLVLQLGDYVLEATAANYWPLKRELHVVGQVDQTIELQLRPLPPAVGRESSPVYASPWFWTGVGVIAAGAAVALVFALQPASKTVVDPAITTERSPGVVISALGVQ